MPITKTEARELLKGDFIPDGKAVDISKLMFRRTTEEEIYRCCCRMGSDCQSGPYYCGKLGEWVHEAEPENGLINILVLCERHAPPKHQREE